MPPLKCDGDACGDSLEVGPALEEEEGDVFAEDVEETPFVDDAEDLKGLTQEEFERIFHEVGEEFDMDTFYISRPLRSRTSAEVHAAVQEVFLTLRAEGLHVARVHADRARELRTVPLRRWLLQRGTVSTYTEGQAPQANGRAENAVKWVKAQTKKLLMATSLPRSCWAMASVYATWARRETQLGRGHNVLPFGTPAHVRSKVYGAGGRHDLDSRWRAGVYVGPSLDVRGGHVVRFEDGQFMTSAHLRPHLVDSDKLVDLGNYEAIVLPPTRRIRTKSSLEVAGDADPMDMDVGEHDPEHAAEQYALGLLKEEHLEPDQLEMLAYLLPASTVTPKRFGTVDGQKVWASGAFIHGPFAGLKKSTTAFPFATRVFVKYIRQIAPKHEFNSLAVNINVEARGHKDIHNVGMNMIAALSSFKKGGLEVDGPNGVEVLEVGPEPVFFDPKHTHSTKEWSGGNRVVLLAYSVRDSAKMSEENAARLREIGFVWSPHLSRPEVPVSSALLRTLRVGLLKSPDLQHQGQDPNLQHQGQDPDLQHQGQDPNQQHQGQDPNLQHQGQDPNLQHQGQDPNLQHQGQDPDLQHQGQDPDLQHQGQDPDLQHQGQDPDLQHQGQDPDLQHQGQGLNRHERPLSQESEHPSEPLEHVRQDLDLVLRDLEDRVPRLRTLLEEEEILQEEYRRVGGETREHLQDACGQVSQYLEEVHSHLAHVESLRTMLCLRSLEASSSPLSSSGGSDLDSGEVDYEVLLSSLEEDLQVVHTVPLQQVRVVLDRWTDAIRKEVENLLATGTVRAVTASEIRQMERAGLVVMAPSKCVFTLKPPSQREQRYKRKCRLVICGNFVESQGVDLYAAGIGTDGLRTALVLAAVHKWAAATSDITGAFLLAPWPAHLPRYGVFPPRVVREAGVVGAEAWLIERPLYGLRESPSIWSSYTDSRLKKARIQAGALILVLIQTVAETELWLVKDEVTDTLVGLLVTYVDDILYFGERAVVLALHAFVEEEWPASSLEWINPTVPVRYLGVEVLWDGSSSSFSISQTAYILDLLRAHNMQDVHSTLLPVPREWVEAVENDPEALESDFDESTLRTAQKAVGEALWLATKSRPDILFVVNHMATYVSRQPSHVIRVGQRLLAYLSGTSDMRLLLGPRGETHNEIVCFTDASYAPFGRRSFGAAVVTLAGSPIAWRASRQSFITLSVMEAELYAATQGCLLMEAVSAVLEEIAPDYYHKVLAIDNSSAASMCAGGAGSQRTRHLKIRANYIREATQAGSLSVRHTPGEYQLADLATKLQPKLRLWRLLTLWGFVGERLSAMVKALKVQLMSVVLILSSMLVPADGASMHATKEPLAKTGWEELCLLLVVTCVAVIGVWEASKSMFRTYKRWVKGNRKSKKLQRVSDLAASAARREVASQAGMSLISERSSDLRFPSAMVSSSRGVDEPLLRRRQAQTIAESPSHRSTGSLAPSTPPRRRTHDATEPMPSPGAQSSVSAGLEDLQERSRVVKDVLKLLTCEELRAALRGQGYVTSGVKEDLVERLSGVFSLSSERADLPTLRQLKFVLWLWREKNLRQRCLLRWTDIFTKTAVSQWLFRWKDAPSV